MNLKYNEIKRTVRHNQLNPIVEKPDAQKLNIETTKSADLSKVMDLSRATEVTKAHTDTQKTKPRRVEQPKKQTPSRAEVESVKHTHENKAVEMQRDAEQKKSVRSNNEEEKAIQPKEKQTTRPSEQLEVNLSESSYENLLLMIERE